MAPVEHERRLPPLHSKDQRYGMPRAGRVNVAMPTIPIGQVTSPSFETASELDVDQRQIEMNAFGY